nr:transposase [Hymenolepis microstoma]
MKKSADWLRLTGLSQTLNIIYYELLKPSETITDERYRSQLMRLIRAQEKRPQYHETHKKVVILQHDNARPPQVAKVTLLQLIFTSLTSFNGTQPGSPALQLVWRSEKLNRLMDLIER